MNDPRPEYERQMVLRDEVQNVLERVRPYIQGDGGDIELVDIVGNHASVRLTGHCVGCPSAQLTLQLGIELAIKQAIPEFEGLVLV